MSNMNEKMFAVQVTDTQEVRLLSCDPEKDLFDIGRKAIGCEWIELVEPDLLADHHLIMMIDEEGKFKDKCYVNCITSHLYGSEQHGDPIVGNAVIVKDCDEHLELMTESEAKQLVTVLEASRAESIEKVAKAFGLRPISTMNRENTEKKNRQPCRGQPEER